MDTSQLGCGDGRITRLELRDGLRRLARSAPPLPSGAKHGARYDAQLEFSESELTSLLRYLDPNADGDLSCAEVTAGLARARDEAPGMVALDSGTTAAPQLAPQRPSSAPCDATAHRGPRPRPGSAAPRVPAPSGPVAAASLRPETADNADAQVAAPVSPSSTAFRFTIRSPEFRLRRISGRSCASASTEVTRIARENRTRWGFFDARLAGGVLAKGRA